MTLNDITVRDLLRKKLHLELHLLKEVKTGLDAFKKDTGVSIDAVHIFINKIDTTPMGSGKERYIYGMIDVEVGLDLKGIE